MTWVLIIFLYAGPFSNKDSMATTHVDGFTSEAACINAGQRGGPLTQGTVKEYRYICIPKQ